MEKFVVSARKYRPQTFDTVVGQQHITTTLKNAIRNSQLAHAFLFCGPRGVGKTTCARILAKTINCENPTPEGEACNQCHSCVSFNEGSSLNIHELDAASNNSVEDIRSLVEQVRFAPQAGKYKVYIIDEVHMLSSAAFNAFLKTLEEPPSYAIFILATTEKHKILPTILSRCQIFDFKRITLQDTVDHLAGIAVKEEVSADETALQLIAQKSEGCMRDALSILDKIVSFTNGEVNYPNTVEHLNILDADYYFRLMDCMLDQDLAGAMLLYDEINKKGFEGDMVLNGFAEFIRNLLICLDSRVASLLEVVESFRQRFVATSQRTSAAYLISALNILNESEIGFKSARNKRLHVELALIKLCYLSQALELTTGNAGIEKKKKLEQARAVPFRALNPIATREVIKPDTTVAADKTEVKLPPPPPPPPSQPQSKLTIEEPKTAAKPAAQPKLGKLEALRQQKALEASNARVQEDKPLDAELLKKAWLAFIVQLKKGKNPAWQAFEIAELRITGPSGFDVVVDNNMNLEFIHSVRNPLSEFLKKELTNKQLLFGLIVEKTDQPVVAANMPPSSREQFNQLAEEYPLVKELKDRLRLELDY